MTDQDEVRSIAIYLEGKSEPLWVVSDNSVPLPDDLVCIEASDGSAKTYKVKSRTWHTAKQGEHSFARVSLSVQEQPEGKKTASFGKYG